MIEIGQLAQTVGQAGASLVEHDNPRPPRQMIEPGGLIRGVPHVFDMRDEARDDDEILRTVAEHLIGNVDVATLGVTNFRVHYMTSMPKPATAASRSGAGIVSAQLSELEAN